MCVFFVDGCAVVQQDVHDLSTPSVRNLVQYTPSLCPRFHQLLRQTVIPLPYSPLERILEQLRPLLGRKSFEYMVQHSFCHATKAFASAPFSHGSTQLCCSSR